MDYNHYERMVRDFCECRGAPQAAGEAIESRHLEIDGHLVGLVPREGAGLDIFIEMGHTWPGDDAPLYERLLRFNLDAGPQLVGFFGLHPSGSHVAYRMRVAGGLSGTELSDLLHDQLPAAVRAYHQICNA
ncbi:CesT family type III secretion system chaperone [Ramlibacter albus]|uniref:CesT family type III secretion system chaperone n=1 Tax=Ramlibacter albus TaxID=2079448 RepID=A0A923M8M8_9BURK|nr:CesT family type III secretion system chaperone [Ramlibacter albus]MBC5764537.1 CesT family type III secretion system chaperone [Ramlibacter albus]